MKAKALNLGKEDVEVVAQTVWRKIRTSQSPITVYVGDTGSVQMHSDRMAHMGTRYKPHWMVGRYDRKAALLTIEDDLVLRRREIMGQPTRCAA